MIDLWLLCYVFTFFLKQSRKKRTKNCSALFILFLLLYHIITTHLHHCHYCMYVRKATRQTTNPLTQWVVNDEWVTHHVYFGCWPSYIINSGSNYIVGFNRASWAYQPNCSYQKIHQSIEIEVSHLNLFLLLVLQILVLHHATAALLTTVTRCFLFSCDIAKYLIKRQTLDWPNKYPYMWQQKKQGLQYKYIRGHDPRKTICLACKTVFSFYSLKYVPWLHNSALADAYTRDTRLDE